jgi:hypothetical protein
MMRCLSVTQPWASLIAAGIKTIETRSWYTSYRGPLAIHATKKPYAGPWTRELMAATAETCGGITGYPKKLPLGAVVAIARLTDVTDAERLARLELGQEEIALGDYGPGRFAWILRDVVAIDPSPAVGHLGLWSWDGPQGPRLWVVA